jgi:hypothetical protein
LSCVFALAVEVVVEEENFEGGGWVDDVEAGRGFGEEVAFEAAEEVLAEMGEDFLGEGQARGF